MIKNRSILGFTLGAGACLASCVDGEKIVQEQLMPIKDRLQNEYNIADSLLTVETKRADSTYHATLVDFDANSPEQSILETRKKYAGQIYKGIEKDIYNVPERADEYYYRSEYKKLSKSEQEEFNHILDRLFRQDREYKYKSDMYSILTWDMIVTTNDTDMTLYDAMRAELADMPVENGRIIIYDRSGISPRNIGITAALARKLCKTVEEAKPRFKYWQENIWRDKYGNSHGYIMWSWRNADMEIETTYRNIVFTFPVDSQNPIIRDNHGKKINAYLKTFDDIEQLHRNRESLNQKHKFVSDSLTTRRKEIVQHKEFQIKKSEDSLRRLYIRRYRGK